MKDNLKQQRQGFTEAVLHLTILSTILGMITLGWLIATRSTKPARQTVTVVPQNPESLNQISSSNTRQQANKNYPDPYNPNLTTAPQQAPKPSAIPIPTPLPSPTPLPTPSPNTLPSPAVQPEPGLRSFGYGMRLRREQDLSYSASTVLSAVEDNVEVDLINPANGTRIGKAVIKSRNCNPDQTDEWYYVSIPENVPVYSPNDNLPRHLDVPGQYARQGWMDSCGLDVQQKVSQSSLGGKRLW